MNTSQVTLRVYNANAKLRDASYYDLEVDQNSTDIKADISTLQNDSIGNLYALGSQQFVIPNSEVNNEFFNYAFEVGSEQSALIFKKTFKCEILIHGGIAANDFLHFNRVTTNKKRKTHKKRGAL